MLNNRSLCSNKPKNGSYIKFGDVVKLERDIVGIFDIDNASYSKRTQEFLNKSEREGILQYLSFDIPNSFILTTDRNIIFTRASSKSCRGRTQ
jgi:hypothetical protein